MNKSFQIIKDNGNGSIDIEYPLYKKETITIPIGNDGNALTGADLIEVINNYVNSLQNINYSVDESSSAFMVNNNMIMIDQIRPNKENIEGVTIS